MRSNRSTLINHYCKKVKRQLVCSTPTKKQLISGLRKELLDVTCEDLSMSDLVNQFGTPEALACELQNSICEIEYGAALNRKRYSKISLWILISILLILLMGSIFYARHIWNGTPVYYKEYIREDDEYDTISPNVVWDETA